VEDGVHLLTWMQDGFAYAESYDESAGRYRGLRAGEGISLAPDAPAGLLVRPEVARRQLEAELASSSLPGGAGARPAVTSGATAVSLGGVVVSPPESGPELGGPSQPLFRRFYGRAALDATRAGRDAAQIAQEIIAHLVGQAGAQVRVTLEIEAQLPQGFPEHVVRTVRENCQTLKFEHYDFEPE
ncbi:MAG TPA: AAA+ family ATPase, partial [Thermaerobacter sp.]